MNEKYFLSIDNGTQSVRAIVFDINGQLIAKAKLKLSLIFLLRKDGQNSMQIIFGIPFVRLAKNYGQNYLSQKN